MGDSACIYCPICGTQFLEILAEDGVIMGRYSCSVCMNKFLILITKRGELVITAELMP